MTKRTPRTLLALFLGAPLLLYAGFVLLPAVNAVRFSFTNWDGLGAPKYVGLKHYAAIASKNELFLAALQHVVYLMIVPGVIVLGLALFYAYTIHRGVPFGRLFRVAFFFPNVISSVAVSILWILTYSTTQAGLLNNLLRWWNVSVLHHASFNPIPFTESSRLLTALPPMMVWGATGFYMVLFLAAMESIDETYYEAAELDGASRGRVFFGITLPLMWDVLTTGIVLMIIGGLKTFDVIWVMESSRPSKDTHTIATLMYSKVFEEYNIGAGTAIAVCLFLLVLLVSVISFRVLKQELPPKLAAARRVAGWLFAAGLVAQLGYWLLPYLTWKLLGGAALIAIAAAAIGSAPRLARPAGRGLQMTVFGAHLLAVVFPLVWILYTSAKTTQQVYHDPFGLPRVLTHPSVAAAQPLIENYQKAWIGSQFSDFFVNSLFVVAVSLALILALGAMGAYALARFEFRGRGILFGLFMAGLIIPMQLILIPLFFQFSDMGEWLTRHLQPVASLFGRQLTVSLHDSHAGIILIYVAASLPFTVFVLTGFFRTLPEELREAALMDGASEWTVFRTVMLPLAKPGLITVAIFNFLGLWNEYLFALVFLTSNQVKTLPLGLASISMQAQYKSDLGLLFAGLVIVMLPTLLVYILLQERLTKGITLGALKG